ncbi:Rv2578c family radical SAM protein [Saccharopolyspora sp. TS4A08]|uniref:Rv2578c family radical SAM protein n=2 Tax=Saccharopolyspora ipomoeae TaxID=3042027 RepID=A0ABT6PHP7_9PSEU|nr:Rv2578c family radical SAM protein [Saccharopolyspora sp. TS4A08]MDI2027474.1 Rv2578c family radical SAM protein [Saccharopolyspora sp. TS4A08]
MRWEEQRVGAGRAGELPLGLPEPVRRGSGRAGLKLPEPVPIEAGTDDAFAIEIQAKSIINRVPGESQVPFQWTVNPYRGCTHACVYCFARRTHTYLDLDSGRDFDSKIVVKVNAPALLRKELASARWAGDHIAMGTNTDPYQRAEGRYRLMPEIIAALRDRANPFSILTKGTLILRDLDLIAEAAQRAPVSIAASIGSVDETLWRAVEPGTPSPLRRLDVVRSFADAGIGVSVLMAPILPGLSDSPEQIDATVAAIAGAGAISLTPIVLHLRSGAREWYHQWLSARRPDLLPLYERLYRNGAYTPKSYQREVLQRVDQAKARHGLARPSTNFRAQQDAPANAGSDGQHQLALL